MKKAKPLISSVGPNKENMCANWIKGYDPELLAVRLDGSKSLGQDGKVSFNGFGFTEYIVVLNSIVSLNNSITEFEKGILMGSYSNVEHY
ncbi:MAG: hypothetical protein MUO54_15490 [Anaerolineales bacterium]|nr:hypothetical protein [Anaerolineales bacterium]